MEFCPEALEQFRGKTELRFDIVVVVCGYRQQRDTITFQSSRSFDDVSCGEGNVLHARSERLSQEARRLRAVTLRRIENDAQLSVGRLDNLTFHEAARVGNVLWRYFSEIQE